MTKNQALPAHNPRYALWAAGWSVATVSILISIKLWAYIESDSSAMLASLLDSLMDAGVSIILLFAVRYSLKPADKGHRYGHGKIEGIAALFQSAMMFAGACFILFESGHKFLHPQAISHHGLALWVSGVAILLSLILVAVQKFSLARAPSLAIEADRAHYKSDIFLNLAVIFALIIHAQGGPLWVDPAVAIVIAGYFAFTSWQIGKQGADMLMDREMPSAVRERIKMIVSRHDDVLGIHDLRTRKSGMVLHISFDVEIDPDLTLRTAHEVTRQLEQSLLEDFPYAEILIHMDPYGDTFDARHSVKGVHH
ncbi:MAG: cation transporter [Alphaproteobacteria bacterium]|nr:cation transporter [Alphaproteobacteria bacterium]